MTASAPAPGDVAQLVALYYGGNPADPFDGEDQLYAVPAFREVVEQHTRLGRTPPPHFPLLCPRGHRIIEVELCVDHNWHVYLVATHSEIENPGQTVFDGTAHDLAAMRVCEVPGCGNVTPSVTCYDHAGVGDGHDAPFHDRVRVRCPEPECHYDGVRHQTKLLALYAIAMLTDTDAVRLPE